MQISKFRHHHTYTPRLALRLTSACTLTYVLRALFREVARPRYNVGYTFIYRTLRRHGYADVTIIIGAHPRTKNRTNFPLYSFPHPIAFSPGAAVAVVARILWVGLSCQSIRVTSRGSLFSSGSYPLTTTNKLTPSILQAFLSDLPVNIVRALKRNNKRVYYEEMI